MLTDDEKIWLDRFKACFESEKPDHSLLATARQMKQDGYVQDVVLNILEVLRSSATSQQEEVILDLMTCVAGFCPRSQQIYPQN